jgi:large conductance mechanosensitive channel
MTGFRRFLFRGNLIDLGLAVVVGVAFNTLVQALISDLVTPFIATVSGGKHDFRHLTFRINGSRFEYGAFINAVVAFTVIVVVVYFFVVAPANRLATLAEKRAEATERTCPECLSEIPLVASRCRYCTAVVPPAGPRDPERAPSATPLRARLTWRPRS